MRCWLFLAGNGIVAVDDWGDIGGRYRLDYVSNEALDLANFRFDICRDHVDLGRSHYHSYANEIRRKYKLVHDKLKTKDVVWVLYRRNRVEE